MKKPLLSLVIALLLLSCMTVQQATEVTTPTETPEPAPLSECPSVGSSDGSWERYTPSTMQDLIAAVSQVSSPSLETNPSFYIETGAAYQFPSCLRMEYEGKYREITEPRKTFLTAWSGIFGEELKRQVESLKHEVLFTENGSEYWFFIHEPLIPYMQNELAQNKPAVIFTVWGGTIYVDGKADQIFLIGEFLKAD